MAVHQAPDGSQAKCQNLFCWEAKYIYIYTYINCLRSRQLKFTIGSRIEGGGWGLGCNLFWFLAPAPALSFHQCTRWEAVVLAHRIRFLPPCGRPGLHSCSWLRLWASPRNLGNKTAYRGEFVCLPISQKKTNRYYKGESRHSYLVKKKKKRTKGIQLESQSGLNFWKIMFLVTDFQVNTGL